MDLLPERNFQALSQAQRWRLHISQTPLAVIEWDMEGRVLSWNPAAEHIFGYTAAEAIGQPIIALIVPPKAEVLEQVHRIAEGLTQEGGPPSRVEHENRRKDGALIRCRWFNTPLTDEVGRPIGVASMALDVTEIQHTTQALMESEQRFRTIFEKAIDGIVIISTEGELLDVNEAFARMHGYAREDMLGFSLKDLDPPESARLAPGRMQRMLAGETLKVELGQIHKDGHVYLAEATASLVSFAGRPAILSFHRDITDRKQAEKDKAELQAQLQQTQKMESLGTLAGGLAHDMNNVLGAILGLASANLEIHPPGSPTYRVFDTISRAATRGGEMVRSLLSFARPSRAEVRELDLNAILREEVCLLERTTLAQVRLELDLEPGLRPIRGDASALTHAFMNLCVNAVDAMPEGGILTLRTRNVDSDWLEVVVEDTGTGMPRTVLDRAMEPFFTTKEVGKGTGLGLSMVYSTVKAHQGQMEIQSEPGKGTSVCLRFSACDLVTQTAEPATEPRSEASSRTLKVLLVDDDELIQHSTQALLQALGHVAITASSGEGALATIEAGFEPDVLILDMNMPGLGGSGTLPRLRAMLPEVPVLLSTGRADQAALDLVEAYPFVTLLSKPFSLKDLQQRLEQFGRGR